MNVWDFQAQLNNSHRYEAMPFWKDVYSQRFPGMVDMYLTRDRQSQANGQDRVVVLSDGRRIRTDDKVRPDRDYGDIAIEWWSKEDTVPGWGHPDKVSQTDYIVYAVLPSRTCYFIPYPKLRATMVEWTPHINAALALCDPKGHIEPGSICERVGINRVVPAKNETYWTISIAFSAAHLLRATEGTKFHWTSGG